MSISIQDFVWCVEQYGRQWPSLILKDSLDILIKFVYDPKKIYMSKGTFILCFIVDEHLSFLLT